jgi:peptide chain release factor subunit 1
MVEKQTAQQFYTDERHIEMWRTKRLIKTLEETRGNGTSFVSLYIPPKDNMNKIHEMLTSEFSQAASIKSKQTRTSVQSAITSTQTKLRLYRNIPTNGLAIFCGVIDMGDGKNEKKITLDIEPFKQIANFVYRCQNTFETKPLAELLDDDEKFGFCVVDGNGLLLATVQGNQKEILQRLQVQLPKKHGRGGQSALRFARIREEKRANYVRKVCEMCTQAFISNDVPNVKGLFLAGSAQLKVNVIESDIFDSRLSKVVMGMLDVSYGQDNGLNQAIEQAKDAMGSVRFIQEKKVVSKFFEQISLDTGLFVFGVQDTMKALEVGALECLLLYEEMAVKRFEVHNPTKGETRIHYLTETQEKDNKYFTDAETGAELDIVSIEPLSEWLLLNYKKYGIAIELITDKSSEGNQFCKGFGGIGGFLRYKMDLDAIPVDLEGNDDFDPDEDFI